MSQMIQSQSSPFFFICAAAYPYFLIVIAVMCRKWSGIDFIQATAMSIMFLSYMM